jgi:hypothetical protein
MALIGTTLSSIYVHEYMHMKDFEKVSVVDETLCIFSVPTNLTWSGFLNGNAGYYNFHFNEKDKPMIEKINKYTEIKAYFMSTVIFIVMGGVILTYVFMKY